MQACSPSFALASTSRQFFTAGHDRLISRLNFYWQLGDFQKAPVPAYDLSSSSHGFASQVWSSKLSNLGPFMTLSSSFQSKWESSSKMSILPESDSWLKEQLSWELVRASSFYVWGRPVDWLSSSSLWNSCFWASVNYFGSGPRSAVYFLAIYLDIHFCLSIFLASLITLRFSQNSSRSFAETGSCWWSPNWMLASRCSSNVYSETLQFPLKYLEAEALHINLLRQ